MTAQREEFLRTEEASEYLGGIPSGSLRAWRHQRKGPKSFKLGGVVRYRKSDLDAWIAQQYEASVVGDELVTP